MDGSELLAATAGMEMLLVTSLVSARFVAFFSTLPLLGGPAVPRLIRTAAALGFALLLTPALSGEAGDILSRPGWFLASIVLKEAAVGATMGFVVSLVFYTLQAAGWLSDVVRGASMLTVSTPQLGRSSTALASLYFQLGLVLFFATGAYRLLLAALAASYELLPLATAPSVVGWQGVGRLCIRVTAGLFGVAMAIAAPVVLTVTLTDVALGWLSRLNPQLNVYFSGMPLKALLGVAVVAAGVPLLVASLPQLFGQAVADLERVIELLGP